MNKCYRRNKITEEISKEIKELRKTIKNKKEDRRLHTIELRGLGKRNSVVLGLLFKI